MLADGNRRNHGWIVQLQVALRHSRGREGKRRGIGYWPPRCRSSEGEFGAGQNPWKSVPYRFANNKTSSVETLVPNPAHPGILRPPPPSSRDFYRRGWEENSAMREIEERLAPRVYIYIYIKYDARLSIKRELCSLFEDRRIFANETIFNFEIVLIRKREKYRDY